MFCVAVISPPKSDDGSLRPVPQAFKHLGPVSWRLQFCGFLPKKSDCSLCVWEDKDCDSLFEATSELAWHIVGS